MEASVNDHRQDIFTSGSYVDTFKSFLEGDLGPLYGAKLQAVLDAVPGTDLDVLDVGGGMGRMSIPLSKRHYVTLSDLSPQMLELARPWSGERLRMQVANASDLPFPDHSFDVLMCIDVVPHLPNLEAVRTALAEARRVLRPSGLLLVDSTNAVPLWTLAFPRYLGLRPFHPRRLLRVLLGAGVDSSWQGKVHHYRKSVFLNEVVTAGFRIERLRSFGPAWCPLWHMAQAHVSA